MGRRDSSKRSRENKVSKDIVVVKFEFAYGITGCCTPELGSLKGKIDSWKMTLHETKSSLLETSKMRNPLVPFI